MKEFRSGYVAILGRPNVGKSTLLNTILGEKISIVTSRPQTTRRRITGVRTTEQSQIIFIDTPGIHEPRHRLGEYMMSEAQEALRDVDLILFLVTPEPPGYGDTAVLKKIKSTGKPVILLINKVDLVKKPALLPVIDAYRNLHNFLEIFPISALDPHDVEPVVAEIEKRLPFGPRYYPEDTLTDQYERFMVAETIREKAMETTTEEVPHAVAVEIAQWKEREDGLLMITADIYVEREGQKGIIIGKRGEHLKKIGSSARADIEKLLGKKVFLEVWVTVRENWRSDRKILKDMGFQ